MLVAYRAVQPISGLAVSALNGIILETLLALGPSTVAAGALLFGATNGVRRLGPGSIWDLAQCVAVGVLLASRATEPVTARTTGALGRAVIGTSFALSARAAAARALLIAAAR